MDRVQARSRTGPPPAQRWKLTVEYDGRPFLGFQLQPHGPSVQAVLEAALGALSPTGPVRVQASGRTDAGVHALGQVVHADLARVIAPEKLVAALNAHLRPHPVVVLEATPVPASFDARLSCRGRRYLYRIINRRAPLTWAAGLATAVALPLDVDAMAAAAASLVGHHDFTSFRAVHCQARSPLRTLDELRVQAAALPGDGAGQEVQIHAAARSFLHHQVRNMVGSLLQVGLGRWPVGRLADVLAARDRAAAGPTAPPDGLYFVSAWYPPEAALPADPRAQQAAPDAAGAG